jgi:hypothetical protein
MTRCPSLKPGVYSFRTSQLTDAADVREIQRRIRARRRTKTAPEAPTPEGEVATSVGAASTDPTPDAAPEPARRASRRPDVDSMEVVAPPELSPTPPEASVAEEHDDGGADLEPALDDDEPVVDPRIHELEILVSRGKWDRVVEVLAADRDGLIPPMALLCAVAAKEAVTPPSWGRETDQLAIEAMACMLGVQPDSPLALVFAKRILRRPTTPWREPPSRGVTWVLLLLFIALGGVLGWIATVFLL